MGAERELEVLTIPVGQLLPGDEFHVKGQRFKLWRLNHLEDRKAQPQFNTPAGALMQLEGEVSNYRAVFIMDSRLVLEAVFRDHRECTHCEQEQGKEQEEKA